MKKKNLLYCYFSTLYCMRPFGTYYDICFLVCRKSTWHWWCTDIIMWVTIEQALERGKSMTQQRVGLQVGIFDIILVGEIWCFCIDFGCLGWLGEATCICYCAVLWVICDKKSIVNSCKWLELLIREFSPHQCIPTC